MSRSIKQISIYLGLLVLGCGAGLWSSRYLHLDSEVSSISESPQAAVPAALTPPLASEQTALSDNRLNFIAQAARQVGPAVVRIDAARTAPQPIPEQFNKPFFRRFFGREQPRSQKPVPNGTGSGFILSADGRLITNAHGEVKGINHLTDEQRNRLTGFNLLLSDQAAQAKFIECENNSDEKDSICLVYVPYTYGRICQTLGNRPHGTNRKAQQNCPRVASGNQIAAARPPKLV